MTIKELHASLDRMLSEGVGPDTPVFLEVEEFAEEPGGGFGYPPADSPVLRTLHAAGPGAATGVPEPGRRPVEAVVIGER